MIDDELFRAIERDLKRDERRKKRDRYPSSSTRPTRTNVKDKIGCLYCNYTGYKTEVVKKHSTTTLWPNFTIEKKSVPCPICNSIVARFSR
jgi:hypothetical protein